VERGGCAPGELLVNHRIVSGARPGTDKPLVLKNESGKELKYQVVTREGYTARHPVE
jgi:hypothetical protein